MGSSSDDDEAIIMPVSTLPDDQLFADVKAFAATLGFAKGSNASLDDPAFDDFAPQKAKEKIANEPTKEGEKKKKKKGSSKEDGDAETAAAAATAQTQKSRSQAPPKPSIPAFEPLPDYKQGGAVPRSLFKLGEEGRWYEIAATLPQPTPTAIETDFASIEVKRQRGEQLLEAEGIAFEASASRQKSGSNLQWLQQAQRGGTTSDKVAAMAVLVQESPLGNLRSLDSLVTMASKRGGARAVVGISLDALKELWLEVLLPPSRKLRFFEQQPLAAIKPGREGDRALLLWTFEDALKKKYAVFVASLENLSKDNLDFVKDRASKTAFDLIMDRPEAEQALLSTLVNKLGDPSRKLASKVGYLLTTLLVAHPGMKAIVVREVESFAFRPGLTDRARYYAVVFLNQMVLTHKDAPSAGGVSLARRLVDVYFTLFKLVMEGKLGTAASLAAAQRAKKQKQADAWALKRGKKKGKAAALAAIEAEQKKKKQQEENDDDEDDDDSGGGDVRNQQQQQQGQQQGQRGEMDARMLSALITGVRRAFPFVAAEEVEPLIEAHADALFRLTHNASSIGVATQALLLLHQLMTSRNSVSDRFYRALYAVLISPELTRSTKAPMFLALLFKALKSDSSPRRVAAFTKRLLQVATEAPANFACGCLVMISELMKGRPGLWNSVMQGEEREGDAVEKFVDIDEGVEIEHGKEDDDDDEDHKKKKKKNTSDDARRKEEVEQQQQQQWPLASGYDMRKREPQFANAERSCFWELLPLASHAHPSVAAMARTLLAGTNISYDGDPLQDLTLYAFLDKFIQKKARAVPRGDSLMQPLRAPTGSGGGAMGAAVAAGAVGAALTELDGAEVAPDDAFFYKYYSMQSVQSRLSAKKRKKPVEDGDEFVSDEDGSEEEDAEDDFLAGEEEGGDDGLSADPDRVGMDYDYSQLAAAMEEEEDDDDDEEDDVEEDSDDDEKLVENAENLENSDDEGGSLGGAEFSDISEDDDDVVVDDGDDGSIDSDEAMLSDVDSLDDDDNDDDSSSSGDEDDAAADAEVAALVAQQPSSSTKKAKRGAVKEESGSDDDLNPFDLAEGTESENNNSEEEEIEAAEDSESDADEDDDDDDLLLDEDIGTESDSDIEEEEEEKGGKSRKKGGGSKKDKNKSIFAAADDFDDLILRDLAGEVEEEEVERVKTGAGIKSRGGRGRGGGGGGRGGRGRGAPAAKRQRH